MMTCDFRGDKLMSGNNVVKFNLLTCLNTENVGNVKTIIGY